jgi:hypothetical protein
VTQTESETTPDGWYVAPELSPPALLEAGNIVEARTAVAHEMRALLARVLKHELKVRKWTVAELANRADRDPKLIERAINGDQVPELDLNQLLTVIESDPVTNSLMSPSAVDHGDPA